MSTARGVSRTSIRPSLDRRAERAEQRRDEFDAARASSRMRIIKMTCMLALGICFWFSVPYYLPLKVDPNPAIAAANEAAAYEGNFSRQVAMPVIAAIAMFMIWRLPQRGRFGGRFLSLPLMYCAWVAVSYLWSAAPGTTGKRLVVFFINAGFATSLATSFSVAEMAAFGFAATTTVAMLSFYVDTLQEKIFAPFDPDYRFTGVMTANYQAMNLVVSIICGLTLARKRPQWLKWIVPLVAFEVVLLYLTRARLSSFLCLILLGILSTRLIRERMKPHTRALAMVAMLAVGLPAFIYLAGSRGGGAAQSAFMMGRTDTENTSNLSNRAPLWDELMESVDTRPWLGFGYAGFWVPERVERVSADQKWMVPNAHNTYLDQVLSLGFVGAFLYTAMLWGGCILAWRRNAKEHTAESLFPAVLLTWVSLTSFAESIPLDPYLPTLLAYSCLAKMAMAEGSEKASEAGYEKDTIIGGALLPKRQRKLLEA